jgi:oxaloacetate decarboxylase gamma subunit
MEGSLIQQGVELMLFGMGTVIVFLTLLVYATYAMSALVLRFAPPPEITQADSEPPSPSADGKLLAIISAAIHRHRSRR